MADHILRFLRGEAPDGTGRMLNDVLAFDDRQIESVHNFIQWLFPLPEASRAVPGSPILDAPQASRLRADPDACAGFEKGLARMARFYAETDGWLTLFDHNHLRITRIITATGDLLGRDRAAAFHRSVLARNEQAGRPINADSLRYWRQALDRSG